MPSENEHAPASTGSRVTSFLTSGTGILTALATLAAAIAGLVTAFSQLGEDSPEPAAQPSPTVTTVLVESDAQRELRSRIPDSIWPTCGPPVNQEEGAVAAFNCKYRTVVGLQYNLFASSQELDEAYQAAKRRYGLAGSTPGGSCSAGRYEGVFRVDGRDAGRVLCFVDEPGHVAAIVWTHDELDILSFAWRDDMKLPALFDSWQTGVGPAE